MQRASFTVSTDFHQFYLWDRQVGPEAPDDYCDADIENRIKVAPHVFVLQPERNDEIPVILEIHEAEPACDMADWDHVAEASLHLPSGQLEVHECTGGPVANIALDPGWYRVRSFHGGFGTIDPRTGEGQDHYMILLWPSPESALSVLKQYRRPAMGPAAR
jgi:hypothetical protein